MTIKPTRKPGSQIAPGQKPLFTDGRTASTHSKVPIAQATAGILYRVRDKHTDDGPGTVWGENLTYADANTLKDRVVAARKSKTARVEPMDVPLPQFAAPAPAAPAAQQGVVYEISDVNRHEITAQGIITRIPPGYELLVNDLVVDVPAPVDRGDVAQARALHPDLALAREAAMAAVRPIAAAPPRAIPQAYRDKTVVAPQRRAAPPPRDKTVSHAPPVVRLGAPPSAPPTPPMSPLKVATQLDGDPLADDQLADLDLHELAVEGAPTEADVAHAERERDAAQG